MTERLPMIRTGPKGTEWLRIKDIPGISDGVLPGSPLERKREGWHEVSQRAATAVQERVYCGRRLAWRWALYVRRNNSHWSLMAHYRTLRDAQLALVASAPWMGPGERVR